jgi:hypothetical protein
MIQERKGINQEMRTIRKDTRQANRQLMLNAIKANDYQAFVASLPENLQDLITPEIFAKIVEKRTQTSQTQ